MKTININGKDFTIEELNELIAQKEKWGWRDEFEGYYYIYLDYGGDWKIDYNVLKYKNHYRTRVEAELRAKQIALYCDMKEWAKIHNEGWEFDWNNYDELKWGIDFSYGGFYVDKSHGSNSSIFGVMVKSKELAEEMLEEFRDRLHIYNEI